ncbi:class II fructose-1,6-bisphosphate aldolase [Anaerotruncus colihominis]|uniref:class II fructose-1,6-bisphosphate aldolase n=1 Tax=Anaerotruncus colihominis TaxID=169435 RepID=UPI0026F14DDD|nr:class II fructose-1,6-bisphosphate aldolase [Anaerotruncus colihominis]
MPLVTTTEFLKKAQEGHYAVGAFNVENLEMAQAVIQAATELNAPVIIQTTSSTVKYASLTVYRAIVAALAESSPVPIAMHLDHGSSYELCEQAVGAGYTSVMIDGSKLSFEENIAVSAKTAAMAKECGIPTEAELGTVGGKEDDHVVLDADAMYTNPQKACEFVERTGVSSLAVAIGTAHGFYKGEPRLDFDRLAEIRRVVSVPLVLHGASGVPDEAVQKTIGLGICKVNFATELRDAYTKAVRPVLANDASVFDPKVYGKAGRAAVVELVKRKITVCGSQGKA